MSSNVEQVKKITLKEVLGLKTTDDARKLYMDAAKGKKPVVRIGGDVSGTGTKHTQYGESIVLYGTFVAANLLTGEIFESSKCYLPTESAEQIRDAFAARRDEYASIGFDFVFSVVESSKSGTGYTFMASTEKTPEQISRRAELLGKFKALPAPKKA